MSSGYNSPPQRASACLVHGVDVLLELCGFAECQVQRSPAQRFGQRIVSSQALSNRLPVAVLFPEVIDDALRLRPGSEDRLTLLVSDPVRNGVPETHGVVTRT